jgi:hypothetical protein
MADKDFLRYFTDIDRVILFNNTWTVASCWLTVPITPIPSAPAYGTLSCKRILQYPISLTAFSFRSLVVHVNIPKKTNAIFVLSTLNDRSYRSLENDVNVTFEFSVVKVGDLLPLGTGAPDRPFSRSGALEIELEAGDYVVYVKLDQSRKLDPSSDYADWNVPFRTYPDITNVSRLILPFSIQK